MRTEYILLAFQIVVFLYFVITQIITTRKYDKEFKELMDSFKESLKDLDDIKYEVTETETVTEEKCD